jgi:PmbA protein
MSTNKTQFDSLQDDLRAIVDRGLKYAKERYPEFQHEIYAINTRSLNITIQAGMVNAIQGGQVGIGVRSVKDRKLGFTSASGILDDNVNFAVDNAVVLSKTIPDFDDRWPGFINHPGSGKDGVLEDAILEYTAEEAVTDANAIFTEAKEYDKRIISVSGDATISYGGFAIGNTEDLMKSSRYTVGFGTAQISAKEGDKTKEGFDYRMGRGVPDFTNVGIEGARKAVDLLSSEPLGKTGEMKVVFDNIAAGQTVTTGLANSINGKSVVEGRTIWADKMADQVGIEGLYIYDDGQIAEDPNMQSVDGEGFPRTKTPIIENGVLKSFLFDNYYAAAHGSENTGHANRAGQQSYEALPNIGASTITINKGNKSKEELAEEIGEGVLVTGFLMGMGHSNLISGDFSIVSPSSFRIENGEIGKPIDSITIAGNLYKSFNQIIGIGNEKDLTFMGKIPSIAYEGFTVSG